MVTPTPALMTYLAEVPDYRHARGKSLPWVPLLELLCVGLLSGQKTLYAIADWAKQHAAELLQGMPTLPRIPSFSTLYRLARFVALDTLEHNRFPKPGRCVCRMGRACAA
jgi:DDE_Tnp_1-associated